jgi:hypothetical protein
MHTFIYPGDQRVSVDLYGLGYRCLHEPASRRLDGKIYCTVHMIRDRSPLINDRLVHARANGEVLVEHCPGDGLAWIEAPPFTAELEYAESLLLEGLLTFYRDARRVCATALQARALANGPPPRMVSNIVQLRTIRITRRGPPSRPFGWEICRQGTSVTVECSTRTFRTRSEALADSARAVAP